MKPSIRPGFMALVADRGSHENGRKLLNFMGLFYNKINHPHNRATHYLPLGKQVSPRLFCIKIRQRCISTTAHQWVWGWILRGRKLGRLGFFVGGLAAGNTPPAPAD